MPLPYKISTLLYCFNREEEVLLLRRRQEPNLGLWSPCGGKLDMAAGESPHACACREAGEEIGLKLRPADLHLTGLVSEHGYQGQAHWLMFLFEVAAAPGSDCPRPTAKAISLSSPPRKSPRFPIPQTDAEQIWPLFWRHRGGFFAAHCHCLANGRNRWTLEESFPKRP